MHQLQIHCDDLIGLQPVLEAARLKEINFQASGLYCGAIGLPTAAAQVAELNICPLPPLAYANEEAVCFIQACLSQNKPCLIDPADFTLLCDQDFQLTPQQISLFTEKARSILINYLEREFCWSDGWISFGASRTKQQISEFEKFAQEAPADQEIWVSEDLKTAYYQGHLTLEILATLPEQIETLIAWDSSASFRAAFLAAPSRSLLLTRTAK